MVGEKLIDLNLAYASYAKHKMGALRPYALADAIVRVSALAVDLEAEVAELDINPLFVFARGQGVKAADALIRPRAPAP